MGFGVALRVGLIVLGVGVGVRTAHAEAPAASAAASGATIWVAGDDGDHHGDHRDESEWARDAREHEELRGRSAARGAANLEYENAWGYPQYRPPADALSYQIERVASLLDREAACPQLMNAIGAVDYARRQAEFHRGEAAEYRRWAREWRQRADHWRAEAEQARDAKDMDAAERREKRAEELEKLAQENEQQAAASERSAAERDKAASDAERSANEVVCN